MNVDRMDPRAPGHAHSLQVEGDEGPISVIAVVMLGCMMVSVTCISRNNMNMFTTSVVISKQMNMCVLSFMS